MAYKFFGEPNMLVKTRKRVPFDTRIDFKPLFRFDDKGEYVTDDIHLIEKLKTRFDHVELIETNNNAIDEELPFEDKTEASTLIVEANSNVEVKKNTKKSKGGK